tara:strand:+ start:783 stop:1205 length:423 start_codon:yes stop_codon:yes gene_type:complete
VNHIEQIKDDILAHPLHRACELELVSAVDGRSEVRFPVNDFTTNPQGALHGGIVYALMDVACFFAAASKLPPEQHAVTIETHSSVLRAASRGEQVVIRAHVDRLGRTLAAMRAEAYAINAEQQERLIATGSVTKAIVQTA